MTHPIHRPYNHAEAGLMLTLNEYHKGRENGIKGSELAAKLGQHQRAMRDTISDLRFMGVLIAGKPETGYFIPVTPNAADEYLDWLKHRGLHTLGIVSRARQIGMADLLGQLSLEITEPPSHIPNNPITQFINQPTTGATTHE